MGREVKEAKQGCQYPAKSRGDDFTPLTRELCRQLRLYRKMVRLRREGLGYHVPAPTGAGVRAAP